MPEHEQRNRRKRRIEEEGVSREMPNDAVRMMMDSGYKAHLDQRKGMLNIKRKGSAKQGGKAKAGKKGMATARRGVDNVTFGEFSSDILTNGLENPPRNADQAGGSLDADATELGSNDVAVDGDLPVLGHDWVNSNNSQTMDMAIVDRGILPKTGNFWYA